MKNFGYLPREGIYNLMYYSSMLLSRGYGPPLLHRMLLKQRQISINQVSGFHIYHKDGRFHGVFAVLCPNSAFNCFPPFYDTFEYILF